VDTAAFAAIVAATAVHRRHAVSMAEGPHAGVGAERTRWQR